MATNTNTATAAKGLPNRVLVAAGIGESRAVTAWLDEGGVDARCAEQGGATLLMEATFGGQEAMVRMLNAVTHSLTLTLTLPLTRRASTSASTR